jgi:hypothetical protein
MTITKNAQKQSVKTWSTIATSLKCNIQFQSVLSNKFEQMDSGQTTTGKYIGFFDASVNLKKGDRITWTGIELFVEGIPFPVYGGKNVVHHIEASLGVEET